MDTAPTRNEIEDVMIEESAKQEKKRILEIIEGMEKTMVADTDPESYDQATEMVEVDKLKKLIEK